ncbi:pyrimidine reductase family protein [Speluncibacter jeojiensis]|uniref:Pyrimidine reductase family protein n=1 Tax=Speluncibacter jeojiensis TaxID=2710754 RepID=A0A9X4M246_9ACTN|nr:pyrimidine reductase family protein [Corynebacteriales bacterium D3-21]
MHHVDFATHLTPSPALSPDELRRLYRYPQDPTGGSWMRINFISSIDGAVAADGLSGGLSTPGDRLVFGVLRELADVVVVGAGTVRAEGYRGAKLDADATARRVSAGRSPVPPIAVVTRGADLDPQSPLFTDTATAPLILTTAAAPADRIAALTDAGARVLLLGNDSVPAGGIMSTLAELGLTRLLCEGGPGLFGDLIAADAVDELCLTTAPVLIGGHAPRIAVSSVAGRLSMRPTHQIVDDDGTLLTRWVRHRR